MSWPHIASHSLDRCSAMLCHLAKERIEYEVGTDFVNSYILLEKKIRVRGQVYDLYV